MDGIYLSPAQARVELITVANEYVIKHGYRCKIIDKFWMFVEWKCKLGAGCPTMWRIPGCVNLTIDTIVRQNSTIHVLQELLPLLLLRTVALLTSQYTKQLTDLSITPAQMAQLT